MRIGLAMEYLRGCVQIVPEEEGMELQRLCPAMMKFCRSSEHREIRARCPSGVRIVLRTDSPVLRLPFRFGPAARPLFEFGVFLDGKTIPVSAENSLLELHLDGRFHTVEILPPHLVECFFGELELADGARIEPLPKPEKKFLFLGDSIMQGMTVASPAQVYADRLARTQNADYYNLSVGGMTAFRELGAFAAEYVWDTLFLCFGVNDFNSGRPVPEFSGEMAGILDAVKGRGGIVLISPIHQPGRNAVNGNGDSFQAFRDAVRSLAESRPGVRFIDGTKLLPHDTVWFVDGIHPNDAGEDLLFQNLQKELL